MPLFQKRTAEVKQLPVILTVFHLHESYVLYYTFADSDYATRELKDAEMPVKQVSLTFISNIFFFVSSLWFHLFILMPLVYPFHSTLSTTI